MKMKFYLSLLLWLAIGWSAAAGPVGRREALKIAIRFVEVDHSSQLRSAIAEEMSGQAQSYYIFNDVRKQGFVIVSGDDNLPAVIGYSDRGYVDVANMPEQLASLLKHYERRVKQLRTATSGLGDSRSLRNLSRYPKPVVAPLVKSVWNQDEPYNNMTPSVGSAHAPTGCLATAMAQIMYFHKWPEQGEGSNSYQPQYKAAPGARFYYPRQSVDFSKSTYDWSNMQDVYRRDNGQDGWTAESAKAVALLMRDAGVAVNMGYTPRESGAFISDAEKAFRNHFGYQTHAIIRDSSDEDYVLSSLKKEFDNGYPVLMTGVGALGGHAWVIDGYDENGYVHVNWGWGGLSDGYYELNFMNPQGLGIGGGGGKFNQAQFFIFTRPKGKEGVTPLDLQPRLSFTQSMMSLVQPATDWGKKIITVQYMQVANLSVPSYTGRLGVALYNDKDEQLRVFTGADVAYDVDMYMYVPAQIRLAVDLNGIELADGVYTLRAVSQEVVSTSNKQPKGAWLPIGAANRIEIEAEAGSLSLVDAGHKPRLKLTSQPKEVYRIVLGRSGSTSLEIYNSSPRHISGSVGLIFSEPGKAPIDTVFTTPIDFYGYAKSHRLYSYGLSTRGKIKPGRYNVDFCFVTLPTEDLTGQAIPAQTYAISGTREPYQIEVLAQEEQPILEYVDQGAGSFDFFQDGKVIESDILDMAVVKYDKIDIGIEVRNFGADYAGTIRYRLLDMQDNTWVDLGQKEGVSIKRNLFLKSSRSKVRIPFKTLSLKEGREYELHVEALVGEAWVDVWSATTPRRYVSFKNLDKITSIDLLHARQSPQVYPNPAYAVAHIANAPECVLYVEIFDLSGRRVQSTELSEGNRELNLSRLASGLYVLRLSTLERTWVQRLEKRN